MPTLIAESVISCPTWCTTDHELDRQAAERGDPGHQVTHDGARQHFEALTTTVAGLTAPTVVFPTQSNLLDGTEVRAGMMLNDTFLDLEGMASLVEGLAAARA